MNKWLATGCIGLLVLGGCSARNSSGGGEGTLANPGTRTSAPSAAKPAGQQQLVSPADASRAVAHINGKAITLEQLSGPVLEAYGLQFLLHMVQLELAKEKAAALNLTVTDEDIVAERHQVLEQLFASTLKTEQLNLSPEEEAEFRKKEYERLLPQFLAMQRISVPEFDLAMRAGAYLRKVAGEQVKEHITEEALQDAFRIEYGEKVRVRHIQLANMQEVAEALRRLEAGEAFEEVAKAMSRNKQTAPLGGAVRPFSRAERYWPQAFSAAAFELETPGDISEVVDTGDAKHLVKLEERIAPKAVRFEDHKEILREKLYNLLVQVRIKQLRDEMVMEARTAMKIDDPVLRRQYVDRMERAAGVTTSDPEQVRHQMELDRQDEASPTPKTSGAAAGHEVARPPATQPGQ